MNDYEVRVYDKYQELVNRSVHSSLNFAISKVEEYKKDENNSIYINNTHTGENYDYICESKSTKVKTIKELNSEFVMKRKKCSQDIDNLVYLIEKHKQDAEMNTQYSKIRMELEYNLKMKLIEYTNYSY